MKFEKTLLLILALGTAANAAAADSISATTSDGRKVTVTAVTPSIIRVTNALPGEQPLPSRAAVTGDMPSSTAKVSRAGNYVTTLATEEGITVTLDSRNAFLTISAGPGKVVTDDGLRPLAGGRQELSLGITSTGSMYGAGERGHSLDLRGDKLVM